MDKRTTVKIHGKEYEIVGSRVHRFRKDHPDWSIQSEILSQIAGEIIVRASIADEKNIIRATGIAHEKESASSINKTSYVECAETSAIGRALACFDYQGGEFASADEVAQAIHQQTRTETQPAYKNPELVQPPQPEQKPAQVDKNIISEPQRKRLYAIGKSNGWKDEEMKELVKTFGYEHSKDIKRDDYNKICEMLEKGIPDVPSGEEKQKDLLKGIKAGSDEKVHESELDQLDKKALECKKQLYTLSGDDIEYGWILKEYDIDQPYELTNPEKKAELVTQLANAVIELKKGE